MDTINTFDALERLDNDTEIYLDLIETFLGLTPPDFASLKQFLGNGKEKDVAQHIHQLKGAALTLGAENLAHSASALESMIRGGIPGNYTEMLDDIEINYRKTLNELELIRQKIQKQT